VAVMSAAIGELRERASSGLGERVEEEENDENQWRAAQREDEEKK
jgi:hypothetical protein